MTDMKNGTSWQYLTTKWIVLIIILILSLLIGKNQVYKYVTIKALFLIGGILLAFVFYLWGRVQEKVSTLSFSIGDIILFLFGGVLVLSSIYAYVPHFSFFGGFAGMSALMIISGIILASLIAFLLRRKILSIQTLLWVSIISALVVVCTIWSSVLKVGSDNDAGSIGNSSYAGAYLLVNLFFVLVLLLIEKKRGAKILAGLIGVVIILSPIFFNLDIFKGQVSFNQIISNPLLISGVANGAVLGIGVGIVASLGIWWTRSRNNGLKWVGVGLIIVLFVSLWAGGQALVNPDSRLHQGYVAQKNANRFVFWDIAYAGMNDRPLLGWGINGYSYVFQKYFDPVLYTHGYTPELWTYNPHNMIAEYAVNTGIIGLVVYLAVIGSAAVLLFIQSGSEDKIKKIVGVLFFGALTGYVVQDLFVFDTVAPLMMFFIIIGFALTAQEFVSFTISVPQKNLKKMAIGVLIVISIWFLYQGSILPWKESKIVLRRFRQDKVSSIPSPANISRMGYADDNAFWASRLVGALMPSRDQEFSEIQKKEIRAILDKLSDELKQDMVMDRVDNFRSRWLLGQFDLRYMELDMVPNAEKINDSKEQFAKAIKVNPNNYLVYLDMSQSFILENDYESAQKWIKAAIALAPQTVVGYDYADAIIEAGVSSPEFKSYIQTMSNRWCGPARIECIK